MMNVFLGVIWWCIGFSVCEDGYIGKHIGKLQNYHNEVSGEVYAVDRRTFLLKGFRYNGNGKDAYFWAGSKPEPGPQGFLVPNENGRTNVLKRYQDKDITITLPDFKEIAQIKWLSIYDLSQGKTFGAIYIPDGFEPPGQVVLNGLASRNRRATSDSVVVLDSRTLKIRNFFYDGLGREVFFWVGQGPQPHSRGSKVPDEHGYLTPLRKYRGEDVTVTLPGDLTVLVVNWLAVYDVTAAEVLGYTVIPDELNVPPSLIQVTPHENNFPNCEQLHRDLQISWEVFGDFITMEVAALMGESDYVSFGLSGSPTEPRMEGADVFVGYHDRYQNHVVDYNITSYFPCTFLIGHHKGVCEDVVVGGSEDYQLHKSERKDGVSSFNLRRRLDPADTGDIPFPVEGAATIIWALGPLTQDKKPAMHYKWSKFSQPLQFGRKPAARNCFSFTSKEEKILKPWISHRLYNSRTRNFTARLGPDGGVRGYSALTGDISTTGLAWYVNGYLIPDIYVKRNTKYRISVRGGTNPYDPVSYHPLIITDDPHGGYSQLSDDQKKEVTIYAGVEYSRTDASGTAYGPKCLWRHPDRVDRRLDGNFESFVQFRNSLQLKCDDQRGNARDLVFTPNRSWPDVLYYHSWTGSNMGGKLIILDENKRPVAVGNRASPPSGVARLCVFTSLFVGIWRLW